MRLLRRDAKQSSNFARPEGYPTMVSRPCLSHRHELRHIHPVHVPPPPFICFPNRGLMWRVMLCYVPSNRHHSLELLTTGTVSIMNFAEGPMDVPFLSRRNIAPSFQWTPSRSLWRYFGRHMPLTSLWRSGSCNPASRSHRARRYADGAASLSRNL